MTGSRRLSGVTQFPHSGGNCDDYWCALSNAGKIAQIKDPITWIMMGLGKINNDKLCYTKFGLVLKLFILIIEVKIHKILSTVIEQNLDG